MTEENSFGGWLIRERVRMGWTQDQLAEKLGCSRITVNRWENNKQLPPSYNLKKLASVLGITEEDVDAFCLAAVQPPPNIESVELHEKEAGVFSPTIAQIPPIDDPIIDNLPFRRNPFFTGREAELEQLRTQLQETGTAMITQPISISGLGGVGKTELALEYAHRFYPDIYRVVLWVNAADKETLQKSYDSLARLLKLPDRDGREQDWRVQAVKQWLREHTSWLLIMDNADDLPLANSFLPSQPLGHILFSTRSRLGSDSDIAAQITLEEMDIEKGLDFLLQCSGTIPDEANLDAARQIVELLGGLPLALDQAGAYIKTGVSCADYLERYKEDSHCLLSKRRLAEDKSSEQMRHPDSVTVTFAFIFQKVYSEYSLAADILRFCAFLHPDAIPEELFRYDEIFRLDMVELDEAVATLQRYSLIKRNMQEKTFSIHRLVQVVIMDMLSPKQRTQWRERVLRVLNAAFSELNFEKWRQCERLLPHILAVDRVLILTQRVVGLFFLAGIDLLQRGQHSEAEPLLVRSLSIHEQLGAKPINTLILYFLAETYRCQGKYEQAERLYLQELSIDEQFYGREDSIMVPVLHKLAATYVPLGKYEQAEALYRRALSIDEQQLRPAGLDNKELRRDYALFLRRIGRDTEADAVETDQS